MDNHFNLIIILVFMSFICSCHEKETKEDIMPPLMEYSYHIQYKKDTIFINYQKEDGSSDGFVPGIMVREGDEYYSYNEKDWSTPRRLELTLKDTCYYERHYGLEYFVRFEKHPVDSLYWRSNYRVLDEENKKLLTVFCYDEHFHIVRIIKPQMVIYQPKGDNEQLDGGKLYGLGKDESNRCEY